MERETEETTDKEQTNFQGSTAHIPPPVNPIPIPEPDVPKTLPKLNIPYPSRHNDQKSRNKASNQMEKIFQIFQDLRFDISFADALLLMPRFAPTIKRVAEDIFVKVRSFHFPTDFVVVDFEADLRVPLILRRSFLRTSRALIDVYEGELILRDGDERIIFHVDKHPQKHVNESIKMINSTCEDSFERFTNETAPACLPPPEDDDDEKKKQEVKNLAEPTAKRQLRITDGDERIIFHVDKHPQKHVNESIKMIRDTCEDSFERFTNEPAPACLPPPKDDDNEKKKQEVKNLAEPTAKRQLRITPCLKNFKVIQKESIFHSNKTPQISSVFAITSALPTIEPKDSLIIGDEHLSTFRVEEIVPIPRESEDTFDNN
ncbi:reverse transcriptase domain-containing protein [Tanacetum coccineum]